MEQEAFRKNKNETAKVLAVAEKIEIYDAKLNEYIKLQEIKSTEKDPEFLQMIQEDLTRVEPEIFQAEQVDLNELTF